MNPIAEAKNDENTIGVKASVYKSLEDD